MKARGEKIPMITAYDYTTAQLADRSGIPLVLEAVPSPLAGLVTRRLQIPTIGIGAGPDCDGQVQVLHDMFGLYSDFVPKHAKQYTALAEVIEAAFTQYALEVKEGSFPAKEHSFSMDESILEDLETPQ